MKAMQLVRGVFARVSTKAQVVMIAVFAMALMTVTGFAQATPAPLFPDSGEVLTDSLGFVGDLGIMPLVVAGAIVGLAFFLIRKARSSTR